MEENVDSVDMSEQTFTIEKIEEKKNPNFSTTFSSYKLRFNDVQFDNAADGLHQSTSLVNSVIEDVTSGFKSTDYVQMSIEGDENGSRINTPFLPVKKLSAEQLFTDAERVYQSKENLLFKQSVKVELTRVEMPVGGVRNYTKFVDIDRFIRMKRCIIQLQNNDNLCCARAIVTAKARIDNHVEWETIRKGFHLQQELAFELHRLADVPIGNCGIEEIKKFQSVLKGYQVFVVSKEHLNAVIYSGPRAEKKIYLYLHDDHFDIITSMAAFLSRNFFCHECLKGYDHKESHRCTNTCRSCYKVHKDDSAIFDWVSCADCNRVFKGPECFALHKKKTSYGNSTCNSFMVCRHCDQFIKLKKRSSEHQCGEKFCKVCKDFFPSDHQCFMLPDVPSTKNQTERKVFVFFDFECSQDDMVQCTKGHLPDERGKCSNCQVSTCGSFQHEPNLCVVHKVCTVCMNNEVYEDSECAYCGKNEYVFSGPNASDEFCQWLFSQNFGATVLCHNFQGYDSYPILQYLYKNGVEPKLIPNGTKTMSLIIKRCKIRMIDTLNFLPMALAKLPATFGFDELAKGFFPHLFNRKENQNAILKHLPERSYYNPDAMMPEQRKKFDVWYDQHRKDRFDFQKEILKYCRSDVDILRKCVLRFRNDFLSFTGVDPISECTTIAAACNLVFRRKFLRPMTIGIIPARGYNPEQMQSAKALQWIKYVSHTTGYPIQHARNGGEKMIGQYKVDGYFETKEGEKIVLEFHGDFWHGNPDMYSADTINPVNQTTMGELFQRTMKKKKFIEEQGYTYRLMWESEFDRLTREDILLKKFIEELDIVTPLQPRDAFYGGRTETFTLFKEASEGEDISYYDFTSLYPFINKNGKVPLGHPVIITENFQDLSCYEGLIKCKVIPPRKLYLPVLPCRVNDKLLFALCRTCAEQKLQTPCPHSSDQRAFVGTWVTDELKKAVLKGYHVETIYEVWHFNDISLHDAYDDESQGVFAEYVNTFLKLKQEASGWPAWCSTEEEKLTYIKNYKEKEGIDLEYDKIEHNPGKRALAKLMLNSFWGKFGQRDNMTQVSYVKEPSALFEKLTNNSSKVTGLNFVNDKMMAMHWKHNEDFQEISGKTNVIVAAYTTAQARLKLYDIIEPLNRRVLYVDTDSVIFSSKEGEIKPPLGDFLGDLTDETPNNTIQSFVSGGPKNYAYRLQQPNEDGTQTCCKIRGITLNHNNQLLINYSTVEQMVKSGDTNDVVTVIDSSKICRNKTTTTLLTRTVTKDYRIVFDKRVRTDDFASLPYGF